MQRDVNPPPIMYSGKLPSSQEGVVQANIFTKGFSITSSPCVFVALTNVPFFPSHKETSTSTISRSLGFRNVPNSEDSIVMADIGIIFVLRSGSAPVAVGSTSPMGTMTFDCASDCASFCHVTTSGPNFTPGTCRNKFIPMLAVVDLDTIPGGATKMM